MDEKLVYKGAGGERVDRYLKVRLNISRERVKELLKNGGILVNGKKVSPSHPMQSGDAITIVKSSFGIGDVLINPECGDIEIIYEDSDLIAVNKPAGIITHPTNRILSGTLVNLLLYHASLSSMGMPFRPGVVHRLDRETSGVVVFAKNDSAHNFLVSQFQNRQVEKEYVAIVQGRFEPLKAHVEFTVSPDKENRTRMEVHYLRGKKAITVIEVLKYIDCLSVLKVKPVTGRTHQIRITLAYLGYPIIGDLKYGVKSELIGRVALHSRRIRLSLPSTGEKVVFAAPLPGDMSILTADQF